jgi:hypothetical protein
MKFNFPAATLTVSPYKDIPKGDIRQIYSEICEEVFARELDIKQRCREGITSKGYGEYIIKGVYICCIIFWKEANQAAPDSSFKS